MTPESDSSPTPSVLHLPNSRPKQTRSRTRLLAIGARAMRGVGAAAAVAQVAISAGLLDSAAGRLRVFQRAESFVLVIRPPYALMA